MKKIISVLVLTIILNSCVQENNIQLAEGLWLAELPVMDDEILPFNFKLTALEKDLYQIEIYNAEEVIVVDEIEINKNSIHIKFPVFEGYITGTFSEKEISGQFIKESLDRTVPFKATHGIKERFRNANPSEENITGIWETEFEPNTEASYPAKGIFVQKGDAVTGTIRTNTGDYRY